MTIYIDCSHTYFFGNNTGIQRVVRNIVRSIKSIDLENVKVIPVVYFFGNYIQITDIPKHRHAVIEFLRKLKRYIYSIFFSKRQDHNSQNSDTATSHNISLSYQIKVRIISSLYFFVSLKHVFNKRVRFQPNDTLLIVDNFWDYNMSQKIAKLQVKGVRIGFMLHDLFPLEQELFEIGLGRTFRNNINTLINKSSFCIAISEVIRKDLEDYMDENKIQKELPIVTNKHGKDMDNYMNTATVRPELCKIFFGENSNNPYITVSTIEPRKNHAFLLDAFEMLWQQGSDAKIFIIGRAGWNCHSLIKRMREHKEFGKKLFVYHDISDYELTFIYKHAKAMITPSLLEGFGLPIIESLDRGCPVFASDIPIYHEVGDKYCTFFSLDNPKYLVECIERYEKEGIIDAKEKIKNFQWPTWKESTEKLIEKIVKITK